MRARRAAAATVASALVMIVLAGTGVSASEDPSPEDPVSGVVAGREFGPEDGYEVVTGSVSVIPGQDPLEIIFGETESSEGMTPFVNWGASYATSTEYVVFYIGKAKAAANIYNGKRIIQVCIWYHHPGRTSDTVCSAASSATGVWVAGAEKSLTFVDNLSINWPKTTFHYQLTQIDPNII